MKKPAPAHITTASPVAMQIDELVAKRATLNSDRQAIIAQRLVCEANGEHLVSTTAPEAKKRQKAVDLLKLNGSTPDYLKATGKVPYGALLEQQDLIDQALEISAQMLRELELKAACERLEECGQELKDAGREIALSLISLERALQNRDRVLTKVGLRWGSPTNRGLDLPTLGKLGEPIGEVS